MPNPTGQRSCGANSRRKWNDIFRLNRGQPTGTTLTTFQSSSEFPFRIGAKNRFVEMERRISVRIFNRNRWTTSRVIPNIPVGRNQNGPIHLNSDRNFRNLWHNDSTVLSLDGMLVHRRSLSRNLLGSQQFTGTPA